MGFLGRTLAGNSNKVSDLVFVINQNPETSAQMFDSYLNIIENLIQNDDIEPDRYRVRNIVFRPNFTSN